MVLDNETGQCLLPYNGAANDFKFDRCFDQNSSQEMVFDEVHTHLCIYQYLYIFDVYPCAADESKFDRCFDLKSSENMVSDDVYALMYMYIHIHIYIFICMYTYIYLYIFMRCTHENFTGTHICTCCELVEYVCMSICTNMYEHKYVYTCVYTSSKTCDQQIDSL